jgi:hypothetical protein
MNGTGRLRSFSTTGRTHDPRHAFVSLERSEGVIGVAIMGAKGGVPGTSPLYAAPGRDARIDVIRGLALLVIFINHIPGHAAAAWMPHNFGFSDAADAFVLLAGVSATLAYGRVIDRKGLAVGAVKVAARIWNLYIAHLALFIIVCGVVATAVTRTQNPLYIEAINIQPFFNDTLTALGAMLTLTYQPNFLDILPLYIVLLALFPLIYLGMRANPVLTLAASAAIWQGALIMGLNLPNTGAGHWFFNPFAWQFLFAIGVAMGRASQLGVTLPYSRALDLAALCLLVLALMVKLSPGNPFGLKLLDAWVDHVQLGTDKTNLAWLRVAHVLALAWVAIRLLPAGEGLLRFAAGRQLAMIGRHSLEVFCAGTVLSIIGQIILAETAFAPAAQLLVAVGGIIVLLGLGAFLTWYQSLATQRVPAGGSAAVLPASS